MKKFLLAWAISAAFSVNAQPVPPPTVPVAACAATGPGALACGALAVGIHEGAKILQGKDAFSESGEGKKALNAVGKGANDAGDFIADIVGWSGRRQGDPSTPKEVAAELRQRRLDKYK